MSSGALKDFSVRMVACLLALWSPFFYFSQFHGHPLATATLIQSLIPFAGAALILALLMGRKRGLWRTAVFTFLVSLFFDLQTQWFDGTLAYVGALAIGTVCWLLREHLALILTTVLTAMLASSVIVGQGGMDLAGYTVTAATETVGPKPAGKVIHIILDEFAGPAGIPEDIEGGPALRTELATFFREYGFALNPRAISEYSSSKASISGILNFDASVTPERHYSGKRPFVLENNAYFKTLHQRNYAINVYQSTYLDYCAKSAVPVTSCFTYRYDNTAWLPNASLPEAEKLSVLLGMFLSHRGMLEVFSKAYIAARAQVRKLGFPVPPAMTWDGRVSPIATAAALTHIRDTITAASAGTAHFAHLLLPHSPYAYDAGCGLRREPLSWLSHHPLHERGNTPDGRKVRYHQYFDQVRCTLRHLQSLFDTLKASDQWDDAEIILHGDHGSRLFVTAPRASAREQLTKADLTDAFSTLFAVKSPRALPVHAAGVVPVSQLLAELVGAATSAGSAERRQPPLVYLEGRNDAPWLALPWPESDN